MKALLAADMKAGAFGLSTGLEYDPAPPFASGSPDAAPTPVREAMAERFGTRLATFRGELQRAVLQKA